MLHAVNDAEDDRIDAIFSALNPHPDDLRIKDLVIPQERIDEAFRYGEWENIHRRARVLRYMEGFGRHPGFLLPWEEQRQDPKNHFYYVDLVTGRVTYRDEYPQAQKIYPRYDAPGYATHHVHVSSPEHRAEYFRRRTWYVDYWRSYLAKREAGRHRYARRRARATE